MRIRSVVVKKGRGEEVVWKALLASLRVDVADVSAKLSI